VCARHGEIRLGVGIVMLRVVLVLVRSCDERGGLSNGNDASVDSICHDASSWSARIDGDSMLHTVVEEVCLLSTSNLHLTPLRSSL